MGGGGGGAVRKLGDVLSSLEKMSATVDVTFAAAPAEKCCDACTNIRLEVGDRGGWCTARDEHIDDTEEEGRDCDQYDWYGIPGEEGP